MTSEASKTAQYAQAPVPKVTDFTRDVYCLLGIPLDAVSTSQTVARLAAAIARRAPLNLSTPNLNNLVAAQTDHAFRTALTCSDLSVTDGMPLVWMARMLGMPIKERVAGSDLFESLMAGDGGPIGVYFFGGPDGAAQAACERLNKDGGPMRGAGFESPGFGNVEKLSQPDMIERINSSEADFVVIAMGTAKGHAWIAHNREALVPPILSHLGAVVNFVAGSLARAPQLARQSGMEWLWRIKGEPALWRRYWEDGTALLPLFLGRVLPQAAVRMLKGSARAGGVPPAVQVINQGVGKRLVLAGAWAGADLGPLRVALTSATSVAGDMELDMTGLVSVDAGFLGLMLLLFGHQSKTGRALTVTGADERVRSLFARSCADYVLDGLPAL